MSVIKSINKSATTKAGLKATLDYVLKDSKTSPNLCLVTGDYMDQRATADKVLEHFWETKEFWNKTNNRQCKHFAISWHKDSPVTNEQALEIIKDWAEHTFPDFSCAIAIHTDREYVHGHIVVNSVSFMDGHKYHMSKHQLQKAKDYCDELNLKYGLSIVEKGKHFDGTPIEDGTIRSYKGDDYKAMNNFSKENEKRYLATLLLEAMGTCDSRNAFFTFMENHEFIVRWEDNRKYITFESIKSGKKYRDKNINQSFTLNLGKEAFDDAFTGNRRIQEKQSAIADTESKDIQLLEEEIRREPGFEFAAGRGESEASSSELKLAGAKEKIRRTDNFITRFTHKIDELISSRSDGTKESKAAKPETNRPAPCCRIDFRALWNRLRRPESIDDDSKLKYTAMRLEELKYQLVKDYYDLFEATDSLKKHPDDDFYQRYYNGYCQYIWKACQEYAELIPSVPIESLPAVLEYRSNYTDRFEKKLDDSLYTEHWREGIDENQKSKSFSLAESAIKQPLKAMAEMENLCPELSEPEEHTRARHLVR